MNMNDTSCIPASPDISGIGVRTAIYVQNLLSFGPALYALADGKVTVSELDSVEAQSTTILITAFAILVSAIIQAASLGLSNFHLAIVLDLSWMNNTNTFIYFLLYLQHKSQAECEDDDAKVLEPTWSVWIDHLIQGFRSVMVTAAVTDRDLHLTADRRSRFRRLLTKFALIVGTLHLSLMSVVGIWMWRHPTTFSISPLCAAQSTVILGDVPISSQPLKIWSLIIYTIFLIPFINLLLPVAALLSLVIYWPWVSNKLWAKEDVSQEARQTRRSVAPICIGLAILFAINIFFIIDIETTIQRNASRRDSGDGEWSFGQTLALLLLLVPLRDLVDTVLDRREMRLQQEKLKRLNEREKFLVEKKRRIKTDKQRQLDEAVRFSDVSVIYQLAAEEPDLNFNVKCIDSNGLYCTPLGRAVCYETEQFRKASERQSEPNCSVSLDGVKSLLAKGADPDLPSIGFGRPLLDACQVDFPELVRLLLNNGADPDYLCYGIRSSEGRCKEYGALSLGERSYWLPRDGRSPDSARPEEEERIRTSASHVKILALTEAIKAGSFGNVKALLDADADPNILVEGSFEREAPLFLAVSRGYKHMLEPLLRKGADPNFGGYSTSPLEVAIRMGEKEIVKVLLDNGSSVDLFPSRENRYTYRGDYEEPLVAAVHANKPDIVDLLLKRGADSHAEDRGQIYTSETPLQIAVDNGHTEVVRILLRSGVNPVTAVPHLLSRIKTASCPLDITVEVLHNFIACDIQRHRDGFKIGVESPLSPEEARSFEECKPGGAEMHIGSSLAPGEL